ncbi:MAG: L,D-transpeptidase family protein [Thermodesulfobacteriota bacterium]
MFAPKPMGSLIPLLKSRAPRAALGAVILLLSVLVCTGAWGKDTLYPTALMNWMVEGEFHALIADKSQQKLTVWRIRDGEPELVESYRCATGENGGDKWVRGDMRTPEGVYFFCSVIDGRKLPEKYGLWAFTTDYPNFVDRRRGKSGDGIWLHGRDKPLVPKPDSNGCIALENQDLIRVSRFIRLQSTPLIVVDRLRMAPRAEIIERERKLRDFIENWRQAWGSKDVKRYMTHYSPNFQSCWLDFKSWQEKKKKLNERYSTIKVKLGKVYLYRQNGLVTSIFTQNYQSDAYQASGIKILYLKDDAACQIYAEDYRRLVDDPNPVAPLLAAVQGEQMPPPSRNRSDFQIRFVSTDEPVQAGHEDNESPLPAAPSRGVVLHKFAEATNGSIPIPQIEDNVKVEGSSGVSLLVALALPVPHAGDRESDLGSIPHRTKPARQSLLVAQEQSVQELPAMKPAWAANAGSGSPSTSIAASLTTSAPLVREVKTAAAPKGVSVSGAEDEARAAVLAFLEKWKSAWEEKNLDRYLKMYHRNFQMGGMDYEKFRESKKKFLGKYSIIRIELDRVTVNKVSNGYEVRFLQSFRGDDYRDKGWKSMVLAGGKGAGFRIVSERWSPI